MVGLSVEEIVIEKTLSVDEVVKNICDGLPSGNRPDSILIVENYHGMKEQIVQGVRDRLKVVGNGKANIPVDVGPDTPTSIDEGQYTVTLGLYYTMEERERKEGEKNKADRSREIANRKEMGIGYLVS